MKSKNFKILKSKLILTIGRLFWYQMFIQDGNVYYNYMSDYKRLDIEFYTHEMYLSTSSLGDILPPVGELIILIDSEGSLIPCRRLDLGLNSGELKGENKFTSWINKREFKHSNK